MCKLYKSVLQICTTEYTVVLFCHVVRTTLTRLMIVLSVQYCTPMWCTVLYCTILLYCVVYGSTKPYSILYTVLYRLYSTVTYSSTQYDTGRAIIRQMSTVQYHHNTVCFQTSLHTCNHFTVAEKCLRNYRRITPIRYIRPVHCW